MWLQQTKPRSSLLTLRNTAMCQRVIAVEGDRGSETFYPGPDNRPSSFLYPAPKF